MTNIQNNSEPNKIQSAIGMDNLKITGAILTGMAPTPSTGNYKKLNGTKPPPFIYSNLPEFLKDLLNESIDEKNYSPEIVISAVLAAVAYTMGNSLRFDMPGYKAKPIIWPCIVAPRGAKKSHPINDAMKPLLNIQRERRAAHKEELKAFDASDGDRRNRPQFHASMLSETTTEGAEKAMERNEHGIILLPDELRTWLASFAKYSGTSSDAEWCSLWDGTWWEAGRKNYDNQVSIDNVCVNLIGTIQPTLLKDKLSGLVEGGLFDRIAWVFPTVSTWMDVKAQPRCVAWMQYNKFMTKFYEVTHSRESKYIRVENLDNFLELYNAFGRTIDHLDDADPRRGLASKAQTNLGRMCLLAHGMSVAFEGKDYWEPLTNKELTLANELTLYFYQSGLHAYHVIGNSSPIDTLNPTKRLLYESLPHYMMRRGDIQDTAKSLKIGSAGKKIGFSMCVRTVDTFLNDKDFFTKGNDGDYMKIL